MPVEVVPRSVLAPRRPRIGVPGGVLDLSQARPGVQARGDERVPQVMGMEAARLGRNGRRRQTAECLPRPGPMPTPPRGRDEEATELLGWFVGWLLVLVLSISHIVASETTYGKFQVSDPDEVSRSPTGSGTGALHPRRPDG